MSGSASEGARTPWTPKQIADDAIERATRLIGAKKIPSSVCTVVLDRRVTSTLLAVVAGALSGEAIVKNRSMFAGRVGESVGVPELDLRRRSDRRAFPRCFEKRRRGPRLQAEPSDRPGNACAGSSTTRRRLARAATSSTGSAVRGGYATTPTAGCRAVTIAPGSLDQPGVLAAVGDGLFVQSITGVHSGVNSVSGDFSVGAEGLLIRGGELAGPVHEVTIASTLQRMLLSLVVIGGDVEWLPGVAAAQTVAIDGMSLSGS